jgi:hypothetical protein
MLYHVKTPSLVGGLAVFALPAKNILSPELLLLNAGSGFFIFEP